MLDVNAGAKRTSARVAKTKPQKSNRALNRFPLMAMTENTLKIYYLEIVTPDVDAACALYSLMYGVTFGDADPNLGGARVSNLTGGGMIGVRAPLRDTEQPVVRPYVLVEDIKVSIEAASKSGAEIAIPPMEIPGYGQFAIVIQGGIESGLWQV